MMRSLRWKAFAFLLVFCLWMSSPAAACSPAQDPSDFSLDDYVANAQIVFVGRILGGENPYGDDVIMTAEVEVETYLKGEGSALVELSGYGYGSDCLSVVHVGGRYIFFANQTGDGKLQAAYMSAHDAVMGATAPNIAAISLITSQSNAPEALPVEQKLIRFFDKHGQGILGLSLAIVGVLGTAILLKRKPSGKAKLKNEEIA
jgi:hypothetical protein